MGTVKPPAGFTALQWAAGTANKYYDVIGVCVDYLEPTKSRGTDYTCQFVLHDPTWFQDRGMKFRFFSNLIVNLPQIQANGDVVILRNVSTKSYANQLLGMSNSTTSWVVLSGSSISESTCPHGTDITFVASSKGYERAPKPTEEELKYAKEIHSQEDTTNFRPPPKSTALEVENRIVAAGGTPTPRREKWQPIKDLTPQPRVGVYNFVDLFGEVRKTWYSDFGRVELSLTDYTTNKLLYSYSEVPQNRDGDTYGYADNLHERWPGPWGRMTISVTLFDAHAYFAKSNVQPGMYVLLRNCQIKLDKMGSKLEALLRGDQSDTSKVNVIIFQPHKAENDQKFKDLLKRRLDYEREAKSKGLRFGFSNAARQEKKKRSLEDTMNVDLNDSKADNVSKKESKSAKRKRKKANKENEETTEHSAATNDVQSNQYVRCNNINVPVKSIEEILDREILKRKSPQGYEYHLPFQNCSYKCRVRVVDYYPNNLADFCVPYLVSDYDALSDAGPPEDTELALSAAQSNPHTVRWEWRFFLIVEDASPSPPNSLPRQQMALLVADQDGDYLLRDEASDLRANSQELAKLKEKLFVLWGDLQERKEEAAMGGKSLSVKAQSKPFECFVNEYGVPLPNPESPDSKLKGYQRTFRLFGTSI